MNEREEFLLYKVKSELFDLWQKCNEMSDLNQHLEELIKIICKFLQTKSAFLLINGNIIKDKNNLIFFQPLNSLSFLNNTEKISGLICKKNKACSYFCDIKSTAFSSYNKGLLLINTNKEQMGLILLKKPEITDCPSNDWWENFSQTIYQYLEKMFTLKTIVNEENRYKKLHRVTMKIHSSMDIDGVLWEVIHVLNEQYPSFFYHLLLSNDTNNDSELPIKLLNYTESESLAMEAYVTGEFRIEEVHKENKTILYFPLKGKQGVYGVLQIVAPFIKIPRSEIEFISILANACGNAMENAHLYQQSKQLVKDLRLVTKVSQQLNANLRLSERVNYIVNQLKTSFQADEVGFTLLKDGELTVLPGSTQFFFTDDSKYYIKYIQKHYQDCHDSLFIGDFSDFFAGKTCKIFRSVMAEPMKQEDDLLGFSIVLHENPYFFSFDTFKLFQILTQHSSLAFANSLLREELEMLVITDYSTKLYSRTYLDQQLVKSMENDQEGTFILIDIDNFKAINDTFGHQVGDQVLIQLASIIKKNLKVNEIGARWGGEELAIYLPNRSLEYGLWLAKRLCELTQKLTKPRVTISCGVSYWNKEKEDNPLKLFKRADEALYDAKRLGKNRAVAYS